ncbi:MAG: toxin-antitoxin system HicB family antitoxin [Nitrosopumilus sp.]
MSQDTKKKSQTITVRLDPDLIEDLKNDAEMERINVNALISKVLSNHILWERYERKMGLLPMTKPFVKHSIDQMEDSAIVHLAEEVEKDTFADILNFMKGEYSVEDFIEILRSWLYVAWMQHDVIKSNSKWTFKIQHDLGAKWSLYVKTLVTELFHDIVQKKLTVKTTKNSITLVFPTD